MPRSSSRGAAVATLLVAACCLVGVALMQSHRGPVEEVSIKAEEGEYKKVAAKNAWLEKQDHQLKSQEKRAEEQLVERRKTMVVTRLNTELAREEKSNHFLRRRDARLTVDNQQLKLMFLKEKVMLRKARINAMDEKLKTGDLASDPAVENRIIMSMRSKQHRQLPGVRAKKATAAVLKTAAKTQQLAGEHVNECSDDGKPCHEVYSSEPKEDFAKRHDSNLDTQSGFPGDPYLVRHPADAYNAPWHDVLPVNGKGDVILGDDRLGSDDNYVQWKNTALSPSNYATLPWKGGVSTGDVDLSYSDGSANKDDLKQAAVDKSNLDNVYEATPLSAGKKPDWHKEWLESQGIKVDGFGMDPNEATDTASSVAAEGDSDEYDSMDDPQWGFENHAMKSQGWTADSAENRHLTTGSGEFGHPMDDDFVSAADFKQQIDHTPDEGAREDHLGSWKHSDPKNLKLMYGDEHHGMISRGGPATHDYQTQKWALSDVSADPQEVANKLHVRSDVQRTGEPFTDVISGEANWPAENMVDTTAGNVPGETDVEEQDVSEEPSNLEADGVNVAGDTEGAEPAGEEAAAGGEEAGGDAEPTP